MLSIPKLTALAALSAAAVLAGCADDQLPVAPARTLTASHSQSSRDNAAGNWALSNDFGYLFHDGLLTSKTEEFSVSAHFELAASHPGGYDALAANYGARGGGWEIDLIGDPGNTWHLALVDLNSFALVEFPQVTVSVGAWHTMEVGRHAGRWFATIDGHTTDVGANPAPVALAANGQGTTQFMGNVDGWIDNIAINDLDTHTPIESFPIEEGTGGTTTGRNGAILDAGSMVWMPMQNGQGPNGNGNSDHKINACGAVITGPGTYNVTSDLIDCAHDAITVRASNVRLELNGHIVSASLGGFGENQSNGIVVGAGVVGGVHDVAVVGPGEVRKFTAGIVFEGVERSSITNVTVDFGVFGIAPNAGYTAGEATHFSSYNAIAANRIFQNAGHGITMNGADHNLFSANDIESNGDGILLYNGGSNTVTGNLVANNYERGIFTDAGSGTVLQNLITANRVTGNYQTDMQEAWGDCTHNTWVGNVFGTKSPDCIR